MKKTYSVLVIALTALSFHQAHSDDTNLKVDNHGDQDTSITIHKGVLPSPSPSVLELRIMEETDSLAGEPAGDRSEAYRSWKKACDEWKKELKANNGKQLISSSCGVPEMQQDPVTFSKMMTSKGTYKLKVSVKDTN